MLRRLLTLILAFPLLVPIAAATAAPAAAKYVAVIDAGSSGSRVYLYEITGTEVRSRFEQKVAPGLSSYVNRPAEAGPQGIDPLLTALTAQLATIGVARSDVPVSVLATAGMRLVADEQPKAVRSIYSSVRASIVAAGFRPERVRTISGHAEGLYSWTDVNYLRGVFEDKRPARGIAEVGGASAQVAFTAGPGAKHVSDVRLGGRRYRVYAVSFLGLGQNEARQSALRARDARRGSPCFPNNAAAADPRRYDEANDVAVRAAASRFLWQECARRYAGVIDQVAVRPTMRAVRTTPGFARARFLGLSSLSHAMSDFGVGTRGEAQGLRQAVRRACDGENAWPTVLRRFGGTVDAFSENGCANAAYSHAFAFSEFGMGLADTHFRAVDEIAGQPLTWTRGYALLQASGQS